MQVCSCLNSSCFACQWDGNSHGAFSRELGIVSSPLVVPLPSSLDFCYSETSHDIHGIHPRKWNMNSYLLFVENTEPYQAHFLTITTLWHSLQSVLIHLEAVSFRPHFPRLPMKIGNTMTAFIIISFWAYKANCSPWWVWINRTSGFYTRKYFDLSWEAVNLRKKSGQVQRQKTTWIVYWIVIQ